MPSAAPASPSIFTLNAPIIYVTLDSIELRAQNERRYTHPKTPKMNAHCERFNRTVQEACIDYHYDRLFLDDLTDLNLELLRFLDRYIDNL